MSELARGLFAKPPRDNAPSFMKASLSFHVDNFIDFLNKHKNSSGYVNVDILSKKDDVTKWNAFLNDWKPKVSHQNNDDVTF